MSDAGPVGRAGVSHRRDERSTAPPPSPTTWLAGLGERAGPLPGRTAGRRRRLRALREGARPVPITFVVVGAQKAATSTLYRMLVEHPMVAGGPEKEINHFLEDDDAAERGATAPGPGRRRYVRPAAAPTEVAAGDATPSYLFRERALAGIAAHEPALPVIASLRDPIERACSHWAMLRRRFPGYPDLPDCIDLFGAATAADVPEPWRLTSVFARGRYGEQLARGLALIPAEQWLVVSFDDVVRRHAAVLDRVTDHLGLPPFEAHPAPEHHNATSQHNGGRAPSLAQLERLVEGYAADLAVLGGLSDVDTRGWLTSRAARGEVSLADLQARVVAKLGLDPPS